MSKENTKGNESRVESRQPHRAQVTLHLKQANLLGVSDNLSGAGIMFSTEEDLRVSVEFEGPEGSEVRTGRVVRVQRMGALHTGIAVEFDHE